MDRGYRGDPGGWLSTPLRSEKSGQIEMEGVANLSTDSDYNQLMNHVNANHFHAPAVTSFIAPTLTDLVQLTITRAKLPQSNLFPLVC